MSNQIDRFFSYSEIDGILFHKTPELAQARAQEALDDDCDPDSGWSDNVSDTCWGELGGTAIEINRREKADTLDENGDETDASLEFGHFDFISEYRLQAMPLAQKLKVERAMDIHCPVCQTRKTDPDRHLVCDGCWQELDEDLQIELIRLRKTECGSRLHRNRQVDAIVYLLELKNKK